jgi:Ser/Thr protein kinase RdoA (MazF antagonist)
VQEDLGPLLRAWGLDHTALTRLHGGEINDTYLLETPARRLVVRHYRRTSDPDAVRYELSAVEFLQQHGFPTPAVIRSPGGDLFGQAGGRPAAVFAFADGTRLPSRPGGFGSFDLGAGVQLAGLAAQLHLLTWGQAFPGTRVQRAGPLRRIETFVAGASRPRAGGEIAGIGEFIARLGEAAGRLTAAITARPAGALPSGLVHNDLREANALADDAGQVTAVLDFDDCIVSHRIYDLCALIGAFGLDSGRLLDPGRAAALVAAYCRRRPVTTAERDLLPDVLACRFAADATEVVGNFWRQDGSAAAVSDSYSAATFLSLCARADWQDALRDSATVG